MTQTIIENIPTILDDDAAYVWHPFTQAATAGKPLPIVKGTGAFVYDNRGNAYLDAISSWWVNVHGHGHPALVNAIKRQAETLDHIQFAGVTHPQAVKLAKSLSNKYPAVGNHSWRSFFSDNGSTAVEVALKLAYQYWQQSGQPHRKRFLCLDGGYHGDTVGAMSVGFSSGFYQPFEQLCFPVSHLPVPNTFIGDEEIELKESLALDVLDTYLERYGHETAAFIGEPLLQGAGGMRVTRPEFWNELVTRLKAHGVLVVFDEVFTGFGRTGQLFASEHMDVRPDLVCLSKGLTGGLLPMGVTLVGNTIYDAFNGPDFSTAFAHGHSYTANPITCAVANASLDLFDSDNTLARVLEIEKIHHQRIQEIVGHRALGGKVFSPRVLGLMSAINLLEDNVTYDHPIRQALYKAALNEGILLRPVGNVCYLLPPACITSIELHHLYDKLIDVLVYITT